MLNNDRLVLYPLRVFMQHENESDEEHIKECLKVVEELEDKDYYYLTVELSKRLYKCEFVENYIKEEIYMASVLYKEPYEKGKEEGIKEGIKEGIEKGKSEIILKLLIKKFKKLPEGYIEKIKNLPNDTLEVIAIDIFDINSAEELEKYF
ncbi:DUF4351 domain-containing protein [Clostridium pasteurianum]|uniref:DUF4351 domain-containing protein n=1 Tax=Clostridium pasteurianum TaxID=1501 RepID=UPI002260C0C8|nr:DUF4351 domain-containing protein [Clostridium pasteurianum]UZW15178.1 DUF4351 domain-containing protein [Clostridium pasteurianum]